MKKIIFQKITIIRLGQCSLNVMKQNNHILTLNLTINNLRVVFKTPHEE